MKLEALLSRLATVGFIVATTGIAFNALALSLFCASTALFVLLITAGDYSRAPGYAAACAVASRRRETMPLAA